ncbi:unnamed protein product [Linum trigynum]|uniref:Uncharacterized protein n=1 Tax=Linum trigynum TaxID=586398 RepID=A0AAV2DU64_9ROSI
MVAEYRSEFLKLGNQSKGVLKETLVWLCLAGLKPEIAAAVRVFESDSVRTAFCLAGHKEEELASWRSTIGRYQWGRQQQFRRRRGRKRSRRGEHGSCRRESTSTSDRRAQTWSPSSTKRLRQTVTR